MNSYSQLLRYLKQLAQEDVFIKTVTKGNFDTVDINKKNIFPLCHIAIGNASFPSHSVIRYDVQIGCFDIRDINKEINTDKFNQNDNEQDNLNETLSSLNRMWLKMSKDFEENNITASDAPTLEPQELTRKNLLDGWIITFQVDVPNTILNLCQA
jgi:hypothetical protein